MKIGASYPTTEVPADPDTVRKFVRAIEAMGYTHMMAYDHVLTGPHEGRDGKLAGPYTDAHSFHDPFVLFAFAAAVSDTLGFATGVLVLPQRQTALVAQQAAGIDRLSRGRLRLGVGIGWNFPEYEALGQNFKTRGRRIDEQIGLLRRLWTEPLVSFEGQFDRIDRLGLNPRPCRPVPLWLGGYSEPAYQRGATLGDGFVFAAPGEGAVEAWGRVKALLAEAGRSEDGYGRELLALFAKDAQGAADDLRLFRDAGGTHGCVPSMDKGLGNDIDAHIDYLAKAKHLIDAG
ncbi:LLM class F420-dependent oxidoreductase [Sphingomonas sp. SUN039]|uniref:LLM class F420-dependent oxidoreductase n=1 Tax=Sphingomonas sp. SUN039 TaxID=2937787 RepID=UPI0021644E7B|nr:LLM class F420-dependent oxidoreductase [Sphingomonas sp. SUN039]UVO55751.1 LLM class F420-dependent oxidoreductase [Sphingomonas sp. SUN039]